MTSSTVFRCFGSIRVTTYSISSNCGTHIITAGTGRYARITQSEPFAYNSMPALAGSNGYTEMVSGGGNSASLLV
jgi:hypothetical protein